ncbi:hypothetical protein [Flavonifractor sp. An91]|uniref:hypothetical protein n=1 Tax=Flavonifractor sp. An91 TaxID=1965665 RepID=UPI000B3A0552|nr:hypothetical protein [Flavonifractor sp. An91]OUN10858.1 hypothetical protein B5G42_09430 [Flavonifractor sp. An91]
MKKRKQPCSDWIRKKGTEDTVVAYLIQFIYHLFANSYIQAFVSIIGTVVIAVMIGKSYYGKWFCVAVFIYTIATFLIAWANEHIRQKIKDTKVFQGTLYGLSATLRSMAITLQKCAKNLKKAKTSEKATQIVLNSEIDFQAAAFAVCEKLHDTLSRKEEKDDVYVTVFQKKEENNSAYCRMIAYSAKHEVSSYDTKYSIPPKEKAQLGKIEYHTYVFAKGIKEVTSFHTKELVQKAFRVHESRENREKEIQQYICIPISPAGLGVTFLLQVDSNEQGFFGSSKSAVDDFAKNTIYPYAQLLHMIYEQSRVIEQLIAK